MLSRYRYQFRWLVLAVAVACLNANAVGQQTAKSVNARATVLPAQVKPGAKATLKLTLELPDDTHVNSNAPRDSNLIPTVFTPQATAGIVWGKPRYPVPTEVTEWYADDPLPVYQNGAVIEVPFTIEATATGTLTIGGTLRAQACDHEQCYPPRKIPIRLTLSLGGSEQDGQRAFRKSAVLCMFPHCQQRRID